MKKLQIFLYFYIFFQASLSFADELPEIEVKSNPIPRSASSEKYDSIKIKLVPIHKTGDLLELVPGLVAIQHAGGGKANQYYLRGFDNDHGTDIAFYFEGIPLNNVSHGHGQGFTDLNFIIPELLDSLSVKKGPYFVEKG
ncbi:MAG: Plug domain-containing protein, partial [Deltaproteobacteria bacterium]|nr:Plug domain-containing protein [Deltaproteobacteria bacterium]